MRIISALVLLCGVSAAHSQPSCVANGDDAGEKAIQHLVALVPMNATKPPDCETRVVEYLEGVLAAAG